MAASFAGNGGGPGLLAILRHGMATAFPPSG